MSNDTRKIVFFDKDGKGLTGSDSAIWINDCRIKRHSSIYNRAKVHAHKLNNLHKNIAGYRIHTGRFYGGVGHYSKPIYFYHGNPEWTPTIDTTWD